MTQLAGKETMIIIVLIADHCTLRVPITSHATMAARLAATAKTQITKEAPATIILIITTTVEVSINREETFPPQEVLNIAAAIEELVIIKILETTEAAPPLTAQMIGGPIIQESSSLTRGTTLRGDLQWGIRAAERGIT